ncbi:MAG: hypothetical protein KatS3mg057_0729 [Herpetosiphonaceae bacterium]|nr:MAG: hypothetical protein KatS3mg057_0729 [Herpetosiphonaceae bacterium]
MPRRQIRFARGQYYHIYNRGAGRQSIFYEEKNYHYLLRLIKQVAAECELTMIAYCLLPNHYHWLVRQDGDTPAGDLPRRVFGSYSQAFNRAYQRSGTLFEGPYRAIMIDSEAYLCQLCRYIHSNPVKHGIVAAPESWPYSNYLDWIGERTGTLLDREFQQRHFGTPERYKAYVLDYLAGRAPLSPEFQQTIGLLEAES